MKDSTGAGDAFVGGFLASYLKNESLEENIKQGIKMSQMLISEE